MLKKSDLSKQFELVVQQEIKNYQDSLNFVLQSINEIKKNIIEVQQESLENHALIHSMQIELAGEINNLKNNYYTLNQSFLRSVSDQEVINFRNVSEMRDIGSAILKNTSIENDLQSKFENLWEEIREIKNETAISTRVFNDNIDDLLRRFRKEILNAKNEIRQEPTEATLVKKQLEEKIACHTVDVAGIMRELNIYKKENYITQKKIENIYTLIERISKSEATT